MTSESGRYLHPAGRPTFLNGYIRRLEERVVQLEARLEAMAERISTRELRIADGKPDRGEIHMDLSKMHGDPAIRGHQPRPRRCRGHLRH
jgi:hypothetical protein